MNKTEPFEVCLLTISYPVDTGRKLNVHNVLMYVQFTFCLLGTQQRIKYARIRVFTDSYSRIVYAVTAKRYCNKAGMQNGNALFSSEM